MAKQVAGHIQDLDLNGVAFTDTVFNSLGASAVTFRQLIEGTGHDFFTQEDLIVRTASGGGGTLLVENTDFVLSEEDTSLSARVTTAFAATRHVFKKIQITNAAYQAIDLYVSGEWIGDGVDATYYNSISPRTIEKTAAYTITDTDGFGVFLCSGTFTIDLPTLADNKNRTITIINNGSGVITVDGEGAETINGDLIRILAKKYNRITVFGTESEWIVTESIMDDSQNMGTLHLLTDTQRPTTYILNGGSDTAFTDVDFSSQAPDGTKGVLLRGYMRLDDNGQSILYLRKNGSTVDSPNINGLIFGGTAIDAADIMRMPFIYNCRCDTGRKIEYRISGDVTGVYINIDGYYK